MALVAAIKKLRLNLLGVVRNDGRVYDVEATLRENAAEIWAAGVLALAAGTLVADGDDCCCI